MTTDPNVNAKIGVVLIVDQGEKYPADVIYRGGSRFDVVFKTLNTKPLHTNISVIDGWIANKTLKLVSPGVYEKIRSNIDPITGETATHHADGSAKTLVEVEYTNLMHDGLIEDNSVDAYSKSNDDSSGDEQQQQQQQTSDSGPAQSPQRPQFSGTVPNRQRPQKESASNAFSQTMSPLGSNGTAPEHQPAHGECRSTRKRTAPALIAFVSAMSVVTIVLFFVGHGITSSFSDGGILSSIESGLSFGKTDDSDSDSSDNSSDVVTDGNTIKRTDYDPENAVINEPIATDSQRTIATGLFTAIRQAISNGDTKTFQQIVALDSISSDISQSYARHEQSRLHLTDAQAAEYRDYYKSTLVSDELSHVTNKDAYGSMFGGRVREVRSDTSDSGRLYVVTESLGGDHQRACFVLQSNDGGTSWALSGMLDTDGYVAQILEGDTSAYEQKQ